MQKLVKFDRVDSTFQDTMHVIYYITGGCKFNCTYCDVVDNNRRNEGFIDQQHIVDTLFQLDKPFELYLYGGEPTEYPYIHELIEYIIKHRTSNLKRIELQTNLNISDSELRLFMSYDMLMISPSIHITFLKGDTTDDIVRKICMIDDHSKLERIDFMLEKWKKDLHISLNRKLLKAGLKEKIIYVYNYYEPNVDDVYTGKYNSTYKEYTDMINAAYTSQENYRLTYSDGSQSMRNANELVTSDMSFTGWMCDARKKLAWIDFNGDWWECNTAHKKRPPRGNILTSPEFFLKSTNYPVVCRLKKCDACFFVKKWKRN